MTLTPQEKLALALTSAGSQRALAKLVGVSHQKIGRWLREGIPATIDPTTGYLIASAGAKTIPLDALPAINQAFEIHQDIAQAQAKADNLPYDPKTPIYARRINHQDGAVGNRVLVENTQYIRDELRDRVIESTARSKKYYKVTVRSIVNLYAYASKAASIDLEKTTSFKTKNKREKNRLLKKKSESFFKHLVNHTGIQKQFYEQAPMYTSGDALTYRQPNGRFVTDPESAKRALNYKLRTKMQPAAVDGGLADQMIFQTFSNPVTPAKKNGNTKAKLTRK